MRSATVGSSVVSSSGASGMACAQWIASNKFPDSFAIRPCEAFRAKEIGQIEQDRFLPARRKTRLSRAVTLRRDRRHFNAQAVSAPAVPCVMPTFTDDSVRGSNPARSDRAATLGRRHRRGQPQGSDRESRPGTARDRSCLRSSVELLMRSVTSWPLSSHRMLQSLEELRP